LPQITKLVQTLAVAALLAFTGCQPANQQSAAPKTPDQQADNPSANANLPPELNLAIPALDGTSTKLSQYKGKVLLVNFWATWCQPCKTEIPWLIEFNQKYASRGLVIVGVSMDDQGAKAVAPFVKNQVFKVNGKSESMNYTILLGNDSISDKFGGLLGLPTSYLYSRDGQKVKTIVGLANHDDLTKALENQL
jgi:thiol-disulfide isomerase/thioredoxin